MRSIPVAKNRIEFFSKSLNDTQKEELMSVLVKNDEGFLIEWVSQSIKKRIAYSESRRKNGLRAYALHKKSICYAQENENENENEIRKKKLKKKFIPPTFEEFEGYCKEHGFENIANKAYLGYNEANWHDSQGKQILNWRQKLQHVWFRDQNKQSKQQYGRKEYTKEAFKNQMDYLFGDENG